MTKVKKNRTIFVKFYKNIEKFYKNDKIILLFNKLKHFILIIDKIKYIFSKKVLTFELIYDILLCFLFSKFEQKARNSLTGESYCIALFLKIHFFQKKEVKKKWQT